ncbi:hypothetical protein B4N89_45320 [Embleya scabrispora]|uniref:Uncharacterized protein n=1 Tax=Embleya scabrispora TaxID=159449 RepID=A0A1T3NJ42_9ACTN|nr:hypothetical protein [Embleya scabrispora]OPC76710.1 hypothetical protein B4N89_45320 [Embleya scabrispora]
MLGVRSPYDPGFPARARAIGGDFRRSDRLWLFDPRRIDEVRALLMEFYGTDGERSDVLITAELDVSRFGHTKGHNEVWFARRRIAWRPGRDERVRFHYDVSLVSGGFASQGGTVKYPALSPLPGTVLKIRDIPRTLLKEEERVGWWKPAGTSGAPAHTA